MKGPWAAAAAGIGLLAATAAVDSAAKAAEASAVATVKTSAASAYRTEIEKWRRAREARLREPHNWLSLAGLHWLKPGRNPLDPWGVFILQGDTVRIQKASGVSIRLKDRELGTEPTLIRPDEDELFLSRSKGHLKFMVLKRSVGYGVRVWDPAAPTRTGFKGLQWYSVDPGFKVTARFEPRPEKARKVAIADVIGGRIEWDAPGDLVFRLRGKEHRLLALAEDDGLFIIFKDTTNGETTYSAARYLSLKGAPASGREYDLDFNRATNPPCAYTRFATCPLPPRENFLDVAIEAGEKKPVGGKKI